MWKFELLEYKSQIINKKIRSEEVRKLDTPSNLRVKRKERGVRERTIREVAIEPRTSLSGCQGNNKKTDTQRI